MLGIKYKDLIYNILIQQNLIDKILVISLYIKKAIRAILTIQSWDKLRKENLMLIEDNQSTLKEIIVFFNIFRKPIIKSQVNKYFTLYNAIPNYFYILH